MIEGFVFLQTITVHATNYRNCWLRIDDKHISIFYRPNCPRGGVRPNRLISRDKFKSVTDFEDPSDGKVGITVAYNASDSFTVKSADTVLISAFKNVLQGMPVQNPASPDRPTVSAPAKEETSAPVAEKAPVLVQSAPKKQPEPFVTPKKQPVPVKRTEYTAPRAATPSFSTSTNSNTEPVYKPGYEPVKNNVATLRAKFESSRQNTLKESSSQKLAGESNTDRTLPTNHVKPLTMEVVPPPATQDETPSNPAPVVQPKPVAKPTEVSSGHASPKFPSSPKRKEFKKTSRRNTRFCKLLNRFDGVGGFDEDDDEELPSIPRRQSMSGITVNDLSAKTARAGASKVQRNGVKPLTMQEVMIPTIAEEEEEDKVESKPVATTVESKPATVEPKPAATIEPKPDTIADIPIAELDELLKDDLDDLLKDVDIDDILEDIDNEYEDQPQMNSLPSICLNDLLPHDTPPKPEPIAEKPEEESLGSGILNDIDTDFDDVLNYINKNIEQSNQEFNQRQSIAKDGYTFLTIQFTPKKEFVTEPVDPIFKEVTHNKDTCSAMELNGILRELCQGTIAPKSINKIQKDIQNADNRIELAAFQKWWKAFINYTNEKEEEISIHESVPVEATTEQPTTVEATVVPTTVVPTTEQPTTEPTSVETTEQPTTEQPATEQPTTEQPATTETPIAYLPEDKLHEAPSSPVLSANRLSVTGATSVSWNRKWQALCDRVCEADPMGSDASDAVEACGAFYDELQHEMETMLPSILDHFMCPEKQKGGLSDVLVDRDGRYYYDNGSLYVIPLHDFSPLADMEKYRATSITEDIDYHNIKKSSTEFSQLRYLLAHAGAKDHRPCVPATALIDIAGFRFSLVSALPIRNSACSFNQNAPSAEFAARLPAIPSQAEFQVWAGEDNREYITGCAGLLRQDPLAVAGEIRRSVRPESADGLNGLAADEARALLQRKCREACDELESMEHPPMSSPEFTAFVHSRGISIRHIGILYNLTQRQWLKDLVYVEMLARTAKCILWKNLRCFLYDAKLSADTNGAPDLAAYQGEVRAMILSNVTTFLNFILARTSQSENYWVSAFIPSVLSKFQEIDSVNVFDCNPYDLLAAIEYHCGLQLSLSGSERFFQDEYPFGEDHVRDIPVKVKYLAPPTLLSDPAAMYDLSMKNLGDPAKHAQQLSNTLLRRITALPSLSRAILPATYIALGLVAQARNDLAQSVELASQACALIQSYDSVYMRALALFFYAGQDPYDVIFNILDVIQTYCAASAPYLPSLLFAVGVLTFPREPGRAMEYMNRGIEVAGEGLGKEHIVVVRMYVVTAIILAGIQSAEEACNFFERAESLLGASRAIDCALVYASHAQCLVYLQANQAAVTYAMQAVQMIASADATDDDLATVYGIAAAVMNECGEYEEMEKLLEQEMAVLVKQKDDEKVFTEFAIIVNYWYVKMGGEQFEKIQANFEDVHCEEDNVILWDVMRQAPHILDFLNSCVENMETGENKDILLSVLSFYQSRQ